MEIELGRLAFIAVLLISLTPFAIAALATPSNAIVPVKAVMPALLQPRIETPDCRPPHTIRWPAPSQFGLWGTEFLATLPAFLAVQTLATLGFLSAAAGLGGLVTRRGWSPCVARKALSALLFATPFAVAGQIGPTPNPSHELASFASLLAVLCLFALPAFAASPLFRTTFRAVIRPEDDPDAVKWFVAGYAAGEILLILMAFWAIPRHSAYFAVAFASITAGDLLAGLVGRNLGRLSYRTRALFSRRNYTRTLEGSACVAATAAFCLVAMEPELPPQQFWLALPLLPAALALAEAKAPHRWDEPAMLAAALATSVAIVRLANGC